MKRALMFAVICIWAITGSAYGRQASKSIVLDNVKSLQKGNGYVNNISIKAARDFAERYPEVVEPRWYIAKNGFIVRFELDSIDSRSAYNLRGAWVYTIKVYPEKKMARSVRHLVKSTYYDYTITQIEEIDRPNEQKVYIVHMYDSTTWKNVQVRDGELKVMEEFKKG
jgi:hypothetical protein